MGAAPVPANEIERLSALRSYEILDTACEATFDEIVKLASRFAGTPMALVSLIDSDRQWFKARLGVDIEQTPRDQAFCAHAILGTEPLIVPDARLDRRFADNPLVTGHTQFRFYAGAPLINPEGFALGTLCVIDTQARDLTEEQRDTLASLARTVGTTLELHRTMKRVHGLALTDPLTGLGNRRAFLDGLERVLSHQGRHGGTVDLLCIDLDGFKAVNDRHGHAAGDAALTVAADALRLVTRREDLVARVGGDEFAVVCMFAAGEPVVDMAERIRAAVEGAMRANGWGVTASIGCARLPSGADVRDALVTADRAMYTAKAAGKNQVCRAFPARGAT